MIYSVDSITNFINESECKWFKKLFELLSKFDSNGKLNDLEFIPCNEEILDILSELYEDQRFKEYEVKTIIEFATAISLNDYWSNNEEDDEDLYNVFEFWQENGCSDLSLELAIEIKNRLGWLPSSYDDLDMRDEYILTQEKILLQKEQEHKNFKSLFFELFTDKKYSENIGKALLLSSSYHDYDDHDLVELSYVDLATDIFKKLIEEIEAEEKQKGEKYISSNASNQGVKAPYKQDWMQFRSKTEMRIDKELRKNNVIYFPNARCRICDSSFLTKDYQNLETDFLVICEGKIGILEVDGEEYHQTAAKDHSRDRLFLKKGIKIIQRYTASECYQNPSQVVKEFLELLKQNG